MHINSAIPNHAYYLLVNGGENARDNTSGHNHDGPDVLGIGLGPAEQIFYTGFTSLPPTATMSQARAATVTAATDEYGAGSQQVVSTRSAWTAVGVR